MPLFHDETQPQEHLERVGQATSPTPVSDVEQQRKRMLLALAIVLIALCAVIVRDWDFWFPSQVETPEAAAARRAKAIAQSTNPPANDAKTRKPEKSAPPAQTGNDSPFGAVTERAALPPLEVDVVAGNKHLSVPSKSNAIHLDVGSGGTQPIAAPSQNTASATQATTTVNRVSVPQQTSENVKVTVPPDYPLLARQMKVQGAVSLQALIARDGTIEELQILSGPEILATAAREAVKQWHFKPYLQNGQPIETQAKITVNFTISTN